MIQCPRCGPHAPISVEMISGGIQSAPGKVYKCEVCNLPVPPPIEDHADTVAARSDGVGEQLTMAPVIPDPPRPVVSDVREACKLKRRTANPDFDLIKAARAQLRELDREIRRLRKLEKRRDELKRLLDAASGKPHAVVRNLRANTG